MVVPNLNLEDKFERRIVDLYTARHDADLGRYAKQFYSFMVVSNETFDELNDIVQKRQE